MQVAKKMENVIFGKILGHLDGDVFRKFDSYCFISRESYFHTEELSFMSREFHSDTSSAVEQALYASRKSKFNRKNSGPYL